MLDTKSSGRDVSGKITKEVLSSSANVVVASNKGSDVDPKSAVVSA